MTGRFLDPLELEYLDGRRWKLTAHFEYRIGSPDGLETVYVPKGFITDFASIPRILWVPLPPTGKYGKAAVLHDCLYVHPHFYRVHPETRQILSSYSINRAQADAILNEAMGVLKVPRATRWLIYAGVRAGGWAPWANYRKAER
jgi:hypothetical protein